MAKERKNRSMEENKGPSQYKPSQLSLTKEQRQIKWNKDGLSTNGTRATGHSHVTR